MFGLKWFVRLAGTGSAMPEQMHLGGAGKTAEGRARGSAETFAVLQTSLEQVFPVETLQEVVKKVPAICAPDCGRMSREAFGVLASDLPEADAAALCEGLRGFGLETEVVPVKKLFRPPQGLVTRNLGLTPEGLLAGDPLGRDLVFEDAACIFLAAGRLKDRALRQKMEKYQEVKRDMSGHGSRVETRVVKKDKWEESMICRIEVYLRKEPFRLIWQCDDQKPAYWGGKAVIATDRDALEAIFRELRERFAGGNLNRGLTQGAAADWVYPSRSAFEEEIVWRFSRAKG